MVSTKGQLCSMGERTVFSTNGAGKMDIYMCKRMTLDPHFISYTKTISKGIKDLNLRPEL